MKKNQLIAAVLALSCVFSSAAFAAGSPETNTEPITAAETEETITEAPEEETTEETEEASEAPTEEASESPSETAEPDTSPEPTATAEANAPKLYERPSFIPLSVEEPTAAPTEEASETPSEQPSEEASEVPDETGNEPSDDNDEPSVQTEGDTAEDPAEDEETEDAAEEATEAPTEEASEAPSATAAPTDAPTTTPTAEPTVTPTAAPTKQTVKLSDAIGTIELPSKYTDEYEAYITAAMITVSAGSSGCTYGTEYSAFYNNTELTERQFKNMMAGYISETLEELNISASGQSFYSVVPNMTLSVAPGTTLTATPVFAEKTSDDETTADWYYFPEYTKVTAVSAPADAPASTTQPTATPTPGTSSSSKPSSGGGGGNSSSSSSPIAKPDQSTGTSTPAFTDLGTVPWAADAINFLASKGILNGRSDTIFDPDASVTRAEFTKLVCTALGVTADGSAPSFSDVSQSDWYYSYIHLAAANGIVTGISDTEFAPNTVIKRQEMAAMLYRAITVKGISLPAGTPKVFSDESSIDDYAKVSVSTLSAAGVINGVSDTEFDPYSTATRAQAAMIIYQYFTAVGI